MPHRLDRRKCSSALSSRKQKPKSGRKYRITSYLSQYFSLIGAKVVERTSRIYYTPDQWLLPETEEYLRRNDKQHHPAPIVEHYETQLDKGNLSPSEPTEKMP